MWLQMNGEVRSNMKPPGSEEADPSLSDLTVLGCVQGKADLSEVSNIGPSACLPWVPCYLCPAMCSPVAYIPKSVAAEPTFSICLCQIRQSVLALLAAPPQILRGYSHTPGFPHLSSKLSPPQKESAVLPESLDYTASSTGPRQLTLLCNHHYPHNCFSARVTRKSVLECHPINVM